MREPSSAKRAVKAIVVVVGGVALHQELQIVGDAISSTSSPKACVMLERGAPCQSVDPKFGPIRPWWSRGTWVLGA